ncbi:MAG: NADH-quinone oxidoreductase subunit J, partial [Bellilinea sp.]
MFYILAAIVVISSLVMITRRHPLSAAFALVVAFLGLAGLFAMLQAPLLAILQVLVYAGAIMVLFLFVIMLLALTEEDLGERRITVFKILGGLASLGLVWYAARAFGLSRGAPTEIAGQQVAENELHFRGRDCGGCRLLDRTQHRRIGLAAGRGVAVVGKDLG